MPFIDTFPDTTTPTSTTDRLNFIFDVLPADLLANAGRVWLPRLKVDGTEVLLRDQVRLSESESEIDATLTVTLQNPADRSLFTSTASIEFGIGQKIAGVWDAPTFVTLMSDAMVDSIDNTIAGSPNNLQDKVDVTIVAKGVDKLSKTSERGLIIYDSNRTQISDEELKPLIDSEGRSYAKEILAVPGLNLAHLFQEILVTRCGFSAYHTDLPANDYPIERYEIKFGQRFYDGLKGKIGMFSPAVRAVGDDVWITDTTIVQPAGFPAAKRITIDRPLSIGINQKRQRIDALNLQYVGLENNYDYTTFRFDEFESTNGPLTVQGERITIEFRKKTSPTTNVIVREQLNIDNRQTFYGIDQTDDSSEVYEFDGKGRISTHRKTVKKLLPTGSTVYDGTALQNVKSETEEYSYQAHPFKPRTDIVARRVAQATGLLVRVTDSVVAIGNQPLPMAADTAYRSGLITTTTTVEEVTYEEARTKYREETADPQRDGTVRVRVFEVDELTGLVVADYAEDRAGEIGLSAGQTSNEQLLVFAAAGASRSFDRIEDFAIGELPLKYAIPLARRRLLMRQANEGTVQVPVIAFDPSLTKGVAIELANRAGISLGNYIITGREILISRASGLIMNLTGRAMAASSQPFGEIERYARTIDSGEVLPITITLPCLAGYSLSLNPSSVSGLTIEARHVELPALAWTDLETASIDLTPWDGTDQQFEVRLTAGTVSTPTRVTFALLDGIL